MKNRWITTPLLAFMLTAGVAAGQDAQPAAEPKPEPQLIEAPSINATYSDEEIASIAKKLTGSWISAQPITELDGDGEAKIVMTISAARVQGLDDMLYCEIAREDSLATPYRQSFYQIYRFKDGLRLRTFDIRSESAANSLLGISLVPVMFPATVSAVDIFPTIDIDLEKDGERYAGSSPSAYPDHRGGAVQMTSSIAFDGETISVSDVGYDSEGNTAWEVGRDGGAEFVRIDNPVDIDYYNDQLIVIHFNEPEGEPIKEGDWMVIHYLGRLTDGTKFDSSFDRGEPFRYQFPGTLIPGWIRGTEGMTKGSRRRLIIPSALGYGDRAVGPIPPGSTLVFDVECVFIERPEEPADLNANPSANAAGDAEAAASGAAEEDSGD